MNTNTSSPHIVEKLKQHFFLLCRQQPQMSIRSFAKTLGIDHSLLTKILKGQHPLSYQMALKIGPIIQLSSSEIHDCFKEKKLEQKTNLQDDMMIVLSDWFYFATLELLKIKTISHRPATLASKLNLSTVQMKDCLERLERLEFIKIEESGSIKLLRNNNFWFNFDLTTEHKKILQKQLLLKSLESIDQVEFKDRMHAGLTIAIEKKHLEKYKKLIQQLIQQADDLSLSQKKYTDVYQLCISFFPFTQETL